MREKTNFTEQEARYFKFKMKQIKQARQQGNEPAAQRHGQELNQYFGIGESETPIIDEFGELDETSAPFRDKMDRFNGFEKE